MAGQRRGMDTCRRASELDDRRLRRSRGRLDAHRHRLSLLGQGFGNAYAAMVLEAWFFIAAALLVVSGGAKLWDPAPTRVALEAIGLPSGPLSAHTLVLVETVDVLSVIVMCVSASFIC